MDHVYLADDFPDDGAEMAVEEWRLLYVAVTRARKTLDVSRCAPRPDSSRAACRSGAGTDADAFDRRTVRRADVGHRRTGQAPQGAVTARETPGRADTAKHPRGPLTRTQSRLQKATPGRDAQRPTRGTENGPRGGQENQQRTRFESRQTRRTHRLQVPQAAPASQGER